MPRYEYVCSGCGLRFEKQKAVDDRSAHECLSCGNLAPLVMSLVNNTFGWELAKECHERFGPRDKYVRAV